MSRQTVAATIDFGLEKLFPLERPALGNGVFELGLVLGGTVSAGAYTGGVIDYLMEALDEWTRAKEAGDPAAPKHAVVISTLGGASGGAINGAILLRAAGWSYPHGAADANPFYSAWTKGVDLSALLSASKGSDINPMASLFNCAAIDEQAERTISFSGHDLGNSSTPRQRSYLADPLRLMMMVGNITGTPFRIPFLGQSSLSHDLIAHDDFMRFALTVSGGFAVEPRVRPDEVALASQAERGWHSLRAAALATSAFPVAFRSRPLERPLTDLRCRTVLLPSEKGPPQVVLLEPNWDLIRAGSSNKDVVSFATVDGGTMNNEPFDLVRAALAGLTGHNKRKGAEADRAVVMVDPFSDPEGLSQREPLDAPDLILPFIVSLVQQARFKPADIALAQHPDVHSRFLIAPVGPGRDGKEIAGKKAIASGGLGGFLGFVDRRFLDYDFKLGRRNAYEFLNGEFTFPETNAAFAGAYWTEAQKSQQTAEIVDGVRQLRMIPLMPRLLASPPELPEPWPTLNELPPWLDGAITVRLNELYRALMAPTKKLRWWKRWAARAYIGVGWWAYARSAAKDSAMNVIKKALEDQGLLKRER